MYPLNPATVDGMLQREIQNVDRKIYGKANAHEVVALRDAVARLECTVGELRAEIDELRSWLSALDSKRGGAEGGER